MLPELPPDPPTVVVEGIELTLLVHQGQRVITLKMMDEAHQRPSGTARRAFNAHKRHLIEGEDYFVRNPHEATEFRIIAPNGLVLLTESGYLLLVKSFTDDLAWKVQRALVAYFRGSTSSTDTWANDLARVDAAVSVITDPLLAFQALQRMAGELDLARTQLVELEPKAAFYDAVNGSFGSMTVKDAAQACGMGERRLFAWLKAHGYLQQGNRPYQRWIDRGYFEVRLRTFNIGGATFTSTQPLITGKGLIRIQRELGCGQSIRLELDGNPGGVA